uniref:Uncharacterized protein n=1 Tax=Phlebotomus papatasi TaxID=29031 RepID=A0A1B0D9H9_PHLPP
MIKGESDSSSINSVLVGGDEGSKSVIYDCLNLGRRIDVLWPSEEMRLSGGRSSWREWCPQEGMVGIVRHYWQPNHPDSKFRSNVNRTLLLIQIGEHYVPVGQNGVN